MNYDLVTPVENIFKKVEDLLKYCDMANYPYSQPQEISGGYTIINKTGKFREYIKSWKCIPMIQKTWISFKIHFREAHL